MELIDHLPAMQHPKWMGKVKSGIFSPFDRELDGIEKRLEREDYHSEKGFGERLKEF